MKYLVVSDNHGDVAILQELQQRYKDVVDVMIHCGDSELSDADALWQSFQSVQGNCDYRAQFPAERFIVTAVDRIYVTHGHLVDINFTTAKLQQKVAENQATLALFGHTHQAACQEIDGCLYVNPGSISQPRGQYLVPTYVIIESTPQAHVVTYYRRSHEAIAEGTFHFAR